MQVDDYSSFIKPVKRKIAVLKENYENAALIRDEISKRQ